LILEKGGTSARLNSLCAKVMRRPPVGRAHPGHKADDADVGQLFKPVGMADRKRQPRARPVRRNRPLGLDLATVEAVLETGQQGIDEKRYSE